MLSLFENVSDDPWKHYTSTDVFDSEMVCMLNDIPIDMFYSQYTEQDERDKNYDEKNIMYHDVKHHDVIKAFTNPGLVRDIKDNTDVDLTLKGVKLTLMLLQGDRDVWVHPDSDEKMISIIIYLGTETLPGKGTWLYETETKIYSKPDHTPNSSLTFAPTRTTWHSCPQMQRNDVTRRSLMINYVDIPNKLQMLRDPNLTIPDNVYKLL